MTNSSIRRRRDALRYRTSLRLKAIRIIRKIPQSELAKAAGVTASVISRIESGQVEPSLTQAVLIMERLNIWTVDLLVDSVTPPIRDRFKHDDELVNWYGELDS